MAIQRFPMLWQVSVNSALLAVMIGGMVAAGACLARAVEFGGRIHFAGVPRLVEVRSSQNQARSWGGRYYFTVAVPGDASEPLGRLLLRQEEGADRLGRFDWDQTLAFLGGDRHQPTALANLDLDPQQRSITVVFDPPIAPGQTVTLSLKPYATPREGIYLWGVTAFPAGETVASQFIGYGRLQFYDRRDRPWWRR